MMKKSQSAPVMTGGKIKEDRMVERLKRDLPANDDSNSSMDSKLTG